MHRGSAVIALVGDDVLDHRNGIVGHGGDRLELLGGFRQRLLNRRGIALVRALHGDAHNRAGVEIDGVLGLVRQMRPAAPTPSSLQLRPNGPFVNAHWPLILPVVYRQAFRGAMGTLVRDARLPDLRIARRHRVN
jgi:hypothetical protein